MIKIIKKLYCKLFDYIPYIDIALQYGIELLLLLLIKLYKWNIKIKSIMLNCHWIFLIQWYNRKEIK